MGFTGLALSAMLEQDGFGAAADAGHLPSGKPLFAPKAKSVIWFFMLGGTSHVESFDPKPALTEHAGKTFDESPFGKAVLESPYYRKNVRDFAGVPRNLMPKIYPLQIGYRKHGESGIEVSDWWPHLSECVDDLAIVRSMWTTDNDHAAQLQFHTGRHIFDGFFRRSVPGALRSWHAEREPAAVHRARRASRAIAVAESVLTTAAISAQSTPACG